MLSEVRGDRQGLPAQSKHPYPRPCAAIKKAAKKTPCWSGAIRSEKVWLRSGTRAWSLARVGMLRLRSDDCFAILTAPLSMTLVIPVMLSEAEGGDFDFLSRDQEPPCLCKKRSDKGARL
jgi:hypothetical protein